ISNRLNALARIAQYTELATFLLSYRITARRFVAGLTMEENMRRFLISSAIGLGVLFSALAPTFTPTPASLSSSLGPRPPKPLCAAHLGGTEPISTSFRAVGSLDGSRKAQSGAVPPSRTAERRAEY